MVSKPLPPEQDTQAAKNPAWRIDLDRWEHLEDTDCDRLRPSYSPNKKHWAPGFRGSEWECVVCGRPVSVRAR